MTRFHLGQANCTSIEIDLIPCQEELLAEAHARMHRNDELKLVIGMQLLDRFQQAYVFVFGQIPLPSVVNLPLPGELG